jgi:site-specific DNA recombinase
MKNLRAVAYARFSSDNQRDESIDAQMRAIEQFCEQKGLLLVETYTDRAKSATSDKRPAFQKLITDSDKHIFDVVVVHKLDRFSRDKYDSAKYKHKLKKNGVKVLSVTENLDGSPESIILESVIEGMAEYYSKNLAREVMKGMKETALKCQHTGGFAPLGYSVDPVTRKYVINESEREIVETIFDMYLDGNGYNQIVKALNEKKFKSRYGKAIGKSIIPTILSNEK